MKSLAQRAGNDIALHALGAVCETLRIAWPFRPLVVIL
jgi:hypothetical protein